MAGRRPRTCAQNDTAPSVRARTSRSTYLSLRLHDPTGLVPPVHLFQALGIGEGVEHLLGRRVERPLEPQLVAHPSPPLRSSMYPSSLSSRLGGHDVSVGDPKRRLLGRDTSQLRCPPRPVMPPEEVLRCRVVYVHGEQPGDAHVEGLRGTHQQAGLRPLQDPLRLFERRFGAGAQLDLNVVGPARPRPQRAGPHLVARHLFSVRPS
jgi:hypothetical protein